MKKLINIRAYSPLLLMFIFAACHVSKDAVLPSMGLPDHYREVTANSDTNSAARMPWQSFFQDTLLKTLISEALIHNNDLQIAIKNMEAARLTFTQAKLGNVPVLNFAVGVSSNRPSDNSLNGLSLNQFLDTKHIEDYTAAASISWEADIWGKIRSQKAGALAGYLATNEAKMAVQTQLISDISKGYYNLLMLDAKLEIAKKNVLLNDSTLSIINLQFSAGQVTSLAVQQANAQKLTALSLIPQFEQQIVVQEDALSILCGKLPDHIVRAQSIDKITMPEHPSSGLPVELLSKRPDVRKAELALDQANASVGYAKANLYPSFTLSAQGGLDAFKASNWFNIPASLFGAVAGGLTQPLFQQKKLQTQLQIAKVKREQTVIAFRQSVLIAYGEVSDALIRLDKLERQQELVDGRTETLHKATQNSQMLFESGLANYLEVITAQGNVLQSELELASVKNAHLDAIVDLYRSLGGGTN